MAAGKAPTDSAFRLHPLLRDAERCTGRSVNRREAPSVRCTTITSAGRIQTGISRGTACSINPVGRRFLCIYVELPLM